MATPPEPSHCDFCGVGAFNWNHWIWAVDIRCRAGGRWRCREQKKARSRESMDRRRKDPVKGELHRASQRAYVKTRGRYTRYKAYRYVDNKKYNGGTVDWAIADILMGQPCTYCGLEVSEGLDRRDSSLGHHESNVVPCCSVCNGILVDLPLEVKDLLAGGLRTSRDKGLLDAWMPPQLRK